MFCEALWARGDAAFGVIVFIAVLAVGGGVALAIYLIDRRKERQRAEALQRLADEMGLVYRAKEDALAAELAECRLFKSGHSKRVRNVLRNATATLEATYFDYQYVTGHGKHRQRHRLSVLTFRSRPSTVPDFCLAPRGFFDRVASWFGRGEIAFSGDPEFSKRYLVRGKDETAIRALITNETVAYFLEQQGATLEGDGEHLIYYRPDVRVPVDGVRTLLEEGFQCLGTLELNQQSGK